MMQRVWCWIRFGHDWVAYPSGPKTNTTRLACSRCGGEVRVPNTDRRTVKCRACGDTVPVEGGRLARHASEHERRDNTMPLICQGSGKHVARDAARETEGR